MQMGCFLDKVGALCAVIPALSKCIAHSTSAEKKACALKDEDIHQNVMGTGPDDGDMGLFDDYRMCCSRGSTMREHYSDKTCAATFNATGLQAVRKFHDHYWACVSPGTKTTPKGNWTSDCDGLAKEAEALMKLTLTSHDVYRKPCASSLKVAAAVGGSCTNAGLAPKALNSMWNDWQSIAFADDISSAKKFTKACVLKEFEPGCGGVPGTAPLKKQHQVVV
jgi:hypothetical protein